MSAQSARATALLVVVGLVPPLAASAACSNLKSASPDDGTGAAGSGTEPGGTSTGPGGTTPGGSGTTTSPTGSTTATSAGTTGPGPYGALPTGYCCNSDSECRYRHCVDNAEGTAKVCADGCYESPSICTGGDAKGYTCSGANEDAICTAPAGTACIPANQFRRGDREPGACCSPPGVECATSMCAAYDLESTGSSNPYICTMFCVDSRDCPSPLVCHDFLDFKQCFPGPDTYSCQ